MFPFSALLASEDGAVVLALPGSPTNILSTQGGSSGSATAGLRVNSSGQLEQQALGFFSDIGTGAFWVDSGRNILVPADYEARYSGVTGDTGAMAGSALDTWITCDNSPLWQVVSSGGAADFIVNSVSGLLEIREVAVPSNIVSNTVNITATWEGQN